MYNMSSQRTWDKMNMKDEDYEEVYYDIKDTYLATVRKLKQRKCCVCNKYYEVELTKKDNDYLAQLRKEYDI
jgi:hypothetical protein